MKIGSNTSATADKIDHGIMSFPAKAKDHDNVRHILERGFANKKPNFTHWVYKNRSGAKGIIIWTYMNLGTLREEPLFMTDTDYNLIDISPVDISYDSIEDMGNSKKAESVIF